MIKGSDFLPMPAPGDPPAVTRFAPTPSGYLHLGHAYSALLAWEASRAGRGRFLLRIEDIDIGRCRPEFEQGIYDDLRWLGLAWDGEPFRQSDHMAGYADALDRLDRLGVLYPCFCTRRKIRAEIADAGRAPHGPSGEALYPGICRTLGVDERRRRIGANEPFALRIDVARALELTGPLVWNDLRVGEIEADPASLGDVVLARKDVPTSYHLAVTIDDALQGVTLITRGEDLFHATHIHRLLQSLLGLPAPAYYHHNLIADSTGMRIAKRNRAVTLRTLRHMGKQPADIWRLIGLPEPEPAPSAASGSLATG
ncbi:MAG: tRNA glutamyl-Q(34) synthetase GluQRS [Geminicoccaceae bacterium]